MKVIFSTACLMALFGCAGPNSFERADIARAAQVEMLGMSKEDVLKCMGPAYLEKSVGDTAAWAYTTTGNTQIVLNRAGIFTFATPITRNCIAQISFAGDLVSELRYEGVTGGLFTQGEQCGKLVKNCVPNP